MRPDSGTHGSIRLFYLDDDTANAPEWKRLVKKLGDKINIVGNEVWVWEDDWRTRKIVDEWGSVT